MAKVRVGVLYRSKMPADSEHHILANVLLVLLMKVGVLYFSID